MRYLIIFSLLVFLNISFDAKGQGIVYDSEHMLLGVDFVISVSAPDSSQAKKAVEEAVKKTKEIENIISSWKNNSQTTQINNNAGLEWTTVDASLFFLIKRALKVYKVSDGGFDITIGPLLDLWKFDGSMTQLPPHNLIAERLDFVNSSLIELDQENLAVKLPRIGMKIGFGAIGKGFIADELKKYLLGKGISSGLISAGGDIVVWGEHPKWKNWRVAVANPNGGKPICWLTLENTSIVTSGNYEKFIEVNHQVYSHILDPTTGYPAQGLKSVTVICPNTELADAIATATFVKGKEKGLQFLNSLKGIEGILIDDQNNIFYTENIETNNVEN